MRKYFKTALWILLGFVFIGTFVFLYQKSQPEEVVYQLYEAQKGSLQQTTIVTGNIEPRDEVLIKPQISGIISELYKEAGESVKKGEVIAKVKVIPDMSQLNSAESRVRLAEINAKQVGKDFEREKKLFDEKLISREEYEKSQQTLKQAKEELSTSVDALNIIKEGFSRSSASYSTTLIRSTIDGIILNIPVKVGNSVIMSNTFNDGTTIASVADMQNLIFKGSIDETEISKIHEGMPVKLTIGAMRDKPFDARLEYIAPKVTANTGGASQFEIKAAISLPPSTKVRSGYSANAEIMLQEAKNVLTVPEGSIEFSNDSAYVYILKTEIPQSFERRLVKTGMSDGINIEIKSGLKLKDKVRGEIKTNNE